MPTDLPTAATDLLGRESLDFLLELVDIPGPSGFEAAAAQRWRDHASTFAEVGEDPIGNSYATINAGAATQLAIVGHLDEIGLMVTNVDDKGYLRCTNVGGWDIAVLVGQRVRLVGPEGDVYGSISRPAVHVLEGAAREKLPKLKDLWIDIGAADGDEARSRAPVGTAGVIDAAPRMLSATRLQSRALDNRLGAFVALEALRVLSTIDDLGVGVTAVGSIGEEIGGAGAVTAAYSLRPAAALAIDVTTPGDTPGGADIGDLKLGGGPIVTRGATTSRRVVQQLLDAADRRDLPVQLRGMGVRTRTDADRIASAGAGVPVALVSVPCRYLHSPCEQADLRDVRACIDLIAGWARDFTA